ncbi:hypothetical protein Q7P37_007718 [Cladosporium fusiforme]
MPPTNPFSALRTLPIRQRPTAALRAGFQRPAAYRAFADNASNNPSKLPKAEGEAVGPNMQQQEHVSEEAAKMAKITGGQGPDVDQGTPVQEILEGDKKAREQAPKVMQDSIKDGQGAANAKPSGSRSFSTLARRQQEDLSSQSGLPEMDPSMIPSSEQRAVFAAETRMPAVGHKFPLPHLPLGPNANFQDKYRYDAVVNQVTNLIMKDGKKAAAQRNMAFVLNVFRTAPAPTYSPTRSLLPGAPPASHLPLNPVLYLTLALDSVAPLLRLRSQRGAAGGGVALQIPVPLGLRQRRRQAMEWILDVVSKKQSRSSGRNTFAQRLAEEFISVIEGKSGVWTRRDAVHKLGTTARSNLTFGKGGRR